MRAIGLRVMLGTIGLLVAAIACGGDFSTSVSWTASPEGVTWVLRSIYGEPVLDGTFVWMRLYGDAYEGLDGCNRYFGRHQDGKQVASTDGRFDAPPDTRTLIGCEVPEGILEQADRYLELLRHGESFRVVDDRLEILDGEGEALLVFVRQAPLAGQAVELAGTEWKLLAGGGAGVSEGATTLVFLDDRLAVGTTACREYAAFYRASDGRWGFPSRSMTEYGTLLDCEEDARRQEARFGARLSQTIEYSVNEKDGTKRLRIRTSRGEAVAFEPLTAGVESVFNVGSTVKAFVTVGKRGDPDTPLLRVDRLIPETVITARFHEKGVSGFGGCQFYGASLEAEGPIAREDGTFAKGLMTLVSTVMYCDDPPGVTEQEKRFTELIPQFERYRIYGDLLVVHTSEDVVLLFHER